MADAAQQALHAIGYTKQDVLLAIRETSIPETANCWGGVAGNSDTQLLSAGVVQSNFGQGTLQKLLARFKEKLVSANTFNSEIERLAPRYGKQLFSNGCIHYKPVKGDKERVTADCKTFLLAQQTIDGRGRYKVNDDFRAEVMALFETDAMVQIQVDDYVELLTSKLDLIARLFLKDTATETPSKRQVKWILDTSVQQGGYFSKCDVNTASTGVCPEDVKRARGAFLAADAARRKDALNAILTWYQGHCESVDQTGVGKLCAQDIRRWRQAVSAGLSPEQADLLILTHLKARVASTQAGLYQGNAFKRRAEIIFAQPTL